MIERLIDNWLDKATERAFEDPFRYLLVAEGFTVLHKTRHTAMEFGKDIVAVAPDGVIHAYQLKGTETGRLTLSAWQRMAPQIFQLATSIPMHPSLGRVDEFTPWLVVNGDIDEEVARAIQDQNQMLESRGFSGVRVLVRGELRTRFRNLGDALWPTTAFEFKALLELLLCEGNEQLPKAQVATLLESVLPVHADRPKPPKTQASRALANAAILLAIGLSSFANRRNTVALIEAWAMYSAYLSGVVHRFKLSKSKWRNEYGLARTEIRRLLAELCDELCSMEEPYTADQSFAEMIVYRARMTQLLGLMSLYGLWRRMEDEPVSSHDDCLREFCSGQGERLNLWGEAAVPQMLSYYWYLRSIDASMRPIALLTEMIGALGNANQPKSVNALANPYYSVEEVLEDALRFPDSEIDDDFAGTAFTLEGLFHLLVRENWKQRAKMFWNVVSRVATKEYRPTSVWEFCRWRNKFRGATHVTSIVPRQQWDELRVTAEEDGVDGLPRVLKADPLVACLVTMCYPHRLSTKMIRWLDRVLVIR